MTDQRRIIIADDEIHILRVLELKLGSGGLDVFLAYDGLQAWEEACRNKPDLVISDYQMPGLNGLELAEKMFACDNLRNVPVILLTARGFSLTRDDLSSANILRLISKPFSPRELLALVQETLAISKMGV